MSFSQGDKEKLIRLLEVGIGRSSERLGKMSKTEWDITTSTTKEIPAERLRMAANAGDVRALAVQHTADSDLKTSLAIFFPDKYARALARAVLEDHAWGMKGLDNVLELTIGEVSNILAQSVIGALADEFGAIVSVSVPKVAKGTKAELLCAFLAEHDDPAKLFLMTHIEMHSGELSAECSMVMLFDPGALDRLFNRGASG